MQTKLLYVLTVAGAGTALALATAPDARARSTDELRNPLSGAHWFVDPESSATKQADLWRASRPADAALIDKIARHPKADWFGAWSGDPRRAVARRVTQITATGALPLLVAYHLPRLDCGGTGARSHGAYGSWIRKLARGIGARPAVVILEPDALALMDCLSPKARHRRVVLLEDAIGVLASRPRVSVYLDAGHSDWHSPRKMAARLRAAGVARARGFSLNVSNFQATAAEISYGSRLSRLVGGKHFVIDTGRSGLGSIRDGNWCNPPGRALGPVPTATTGRRLVDAFLWIKPPGDSDGPCNGGPPAGSFWPEYALGLAKRAP